MPTTEDLVTQGILANTTRPLSFRESVDHMVDRALKFLNLDEGVAASIKACNCVLKVQFPVKHLLTACVRLKRASYW